jgi:tRNA-2-methylthio-N6-dimethylallyladenosine synthase
MNKRDSEAAAALLLRLGWGEAAAEADADVVIVNTCSVRGKAEDKALGKLKMLAAAKRKTRLVAVGVMGCMAQRLGDELFRRVPGLDFAIGTRRLAALPSVVECILAGRGPVLDTDQDAEISEDVAGHTAGAVTAFVNILFGCDRGCSYCIVPSVRGREWSRPASAILDEVRRLADGGVREVTLLGQSVMMYGRRNEVFGDGARSPGGFTEPLPRLLEAVDSVAGIRRVRFTSGHPSGCTGELARAMRDLPAVCEHLHVPVQSGSDRVLARMRRGYTADDYRRAVERMREAAPDLGLTTDVIVGFPGETAEDFEATRGLMEEMAFDNAYVFKYSPRPGTSAAEWPDDVTDGEKVRRNSVLLVDQDVRGQRLNERMVGGRPVEVLLEGASLRNSQRWSGRTRSNVTTVFEPVEGIREGDLVRVAVDRAMPQTVYGKIVGSAVPGGGAI